VQEFLREIDELLKNWSNGVMEGGLMGRKEFWIIELLD
jgi:hypothetical protein